jgi:5'-nucleotidase
MRRLTTLLIAALALVLAAPALADRGEREKRDRTTSVQLLAFNDFHGNIQPPSGSSGRIQVGLTSPTPPASPAAVNVDAGGVEYLATHVKALRSQNTNTIVVAAGDNIGASPLISGLFHDEPAIEALNAVGLDVTGVGNHEFDEGVNELLRMQNGGCHPIEGCFAGDGFAGSYFQFLAANVFYAGTHRTILPPFEIKKVDNAKVAFIGLTFEDTPSVVTPTGVAGLEFKPEVPVVNALVKYLRWTQDIRTFVVLIHQGGQQNPPYPDGFQHYNKCDNLSGPIVDITDQLSDDVDVVVSAHTHNAYNCVVDGKLLTSAASFGRLITKIDLTIDSRTKDVVAKTATNLIVTRDVPKDAAETAIIAKYDAIAGPLSRSVVGHITASFTRGANPTAANTATGEGTLGDLIADSQLLVTAPTDFGGAVVAFMNPGGIRTDLLYAPSASVVKSPGEVTYGELFTIQPFGNSLTVKTLTGEQIRRLLEQQWSGPNAASIKILQVSQGFSYAYDFSQPATARVVPGSIKLNGVPIDPLASYRVEMNNFLASGGDNFTVFNEGTNQLGGEVDLDAMTKYFAAAEAAHTTVAPNTAPRIVRVG